MSGSKTQFLYILLGIGLLAAFGMGFVTGRVSAPKAEKTEIIKTIEEGPKNTNTQADDRKVTTRVVTAKSLSPSAWLKKKRLRQKTAGLTTKEGQQLAQGKGQVGWDKIVQKFRHAYDNPQDFAAQEAAEESINALTIRLNNDPVALKQAMEKFSKAADLHEALHFAAVFTRVNDPSVKTLGLDLVSGSNPSYLKAAGFEILRHTNPEATVQPALDVLRGEQDDQVRRAALEAIPESAGFEEDKAGEIVNQMKAILENDGDPEARRRAAILIGTWYRQPADLNCVLSALQSDADVNVRASAATACELSGCREAFIKTALVAVLDRENEDFIVKENAFRALGSLGPIPAASKAAYDRFKTKLDSLKPTEQAPELIESDQQ